MAPSEATPDILSKEYEANPYRAHRVLRDRLPLAYHEGTQSYLLSRHADVLYAFRAPAFSSKNYEWQLEPVQGRAVHQMEGREHIEHRRILNPVFRSPGLDSWRPVVERNARDLIAGFVEAGEVELVSAFTANFPVSVILSIFDLPRADHHLFHDWYSAWMGFLANLSGDPLAEEEGFRARDEFRAYIAPIVTERRRNPGRDLLSHLCTATLDSGATLSDETVVSFCGNLITAGGATTDKAMASMMRNLLIDPALMDAVRADRSLLARTFAETIRYNAPVQMVMRTAIEDVELSGGTVPADSLVTCLIAAANRDEIRYLPRGSRR
jgi:cytochrome P450